MKCKVLLFLLTLTYPYYKAIAQPGVLFNAAQQLSSSFTNQVYLDHDGFIWSATRNGLNKYDGYQFRIYKKEKDQERGMASNYVNCIIQDKHGTLYIGMYGALQTYDGSKFRDVEVKDLEGRPATCFVTCFVERRNGEIWAGTSGFGVLKFEDKQHARQIGGEMAKIHTCEDMTEDRKGNMWIVTRGYGLVKLEGNKARYYFTEAPLSHELSRVCMDKDGTIYVGTMKSGLFKLQGDTFVKIEGTSKPISSLYCNRDGKLMIGYDGNGLGIYDPKTGIVTDNPYYSKYIDLSKCKIYSITQDRSGNYWLGLLQKGLFMQPGTPTGFHYMGYKAGSLNKIGQACVTSTFIDSRGYVWVGTDKDGLYCMDSSHNLLKHYKDNFPSTVLSIAEDKEGNIWIGTYKEGCGWLTPSSGIYHPFQLPQGSDASVFDIAVDKKGRKWIATMGNGLVMVDGNEIISHTMKAEAQTNPKINSITNDYISQISISPDDKRVYVATTMGTCCYDTEAKSWTNTFGKNCLEYGVPTRIAREYSGRLWIGTNDGLYSYDLSKKNINHYTIDGGLSDNGIASIEQDAIGRLWIATDHGLCCHDIKSGLTQSYYIEHGLQSNEFSDGASCASASGKMIFGGIGGITWFDPTNIPQNEWKASVELTDFLINGESIGSSTYSGSRLVTDTTIFASKRFTLSHDDNSFSVQFSTLTYDNPEHITYLYSINGEPWVRLQSGDNNITFSHLAPGTYHFRVKAKRNNKETKIREFDVVIRTPWYQSWWAYLAYVIAIATLIWQYLRMRRRKEQDRLRLQQHIHAEELGEAKLQFFMNISHEIRTPMSLIIPPLQTLMKEDHDPGRRSVYEIIRRNAERILSLINQMMDLRKIDKGMMQMHMQETDLVGFVADIYSLFEHQAKHKGIEFKYTHEMDNLPVWIDRKQFDKVIMNILSNAFKFTPSGGEISIGIEKEDNSAIIKISDNGEQIPKDKLERIFERFYQSPSSVNDRNVGTGIGLDLTRSLVELHHGSIKAHNLDKGCEFVVNIPLGNSHLNAEEMSYAPTEEETINNEEPVMVMQDIPTETVASAPRSNKSQSIVIAEDDDEIRAYLESELSSQYTIYACRNGREALAEVLKVLPDLVLSDIMMPEMDGNTLCTTLKANPQTSHIPIILLTAKNRDEDKLEGLSTGADAYIVKPFNMDILRRTVSNLINSRLQLRMKYGRTDQLEQQVDKIEMKSPDDKVLERVMKVINENLSNSSLSVDYIASQVGISRVHLHRKMKELTGQTPHDFIRNLRLKQAANLLSSGNMNVTEVMYACGFGNAASFSTTFKKFYGMSPREYMQEHEQR